MNKNMIYDKKICSAFISIVVSLIMIKILGADFFDVDLKTSFKEYSIKLDSMAKVFMHMFHKQMINLISVLIILRLKHGEKYKCILIGLASSIMTYVLLNIINACQDIYELVISMVIYLPPYINIFIYVILCEKIEPYIDQYNNVVKYRYEVKPLLNIVISIISASILLSFIQSLLIILII